MAPSNITDPSSRTHLKRATILVILTSSFGVLLSYLKMYVVTATFGATRIYDAYVVAFTFPDIISGLLVGAMSIAFIPLYTEYMMRDGERRAWEFFCNITNLTCVFTAVLSLLLIPMSPRIVHLIAPGFNEDVSALTAGMMSVMIPIIAVMALSRLITGCLNSYHHYTTPALGGVLNLLTAILCVILLSPIYGIYSLAYGVLLGAVGRVLIQVPAVYGRITNYSLTFNIYHPEVRKIARPVIQLVIVGGIIQTGVVVERILASGLSEGSISYLGYARSIMMMPTTVFMGSIAAVLFPVLSKCAAAGDTVELRRTLSAGIRMGNFLMIPMCAAFYFFGGMIIQVLFERGSFVASMTEGTTNALALYSISMLVWALFYIINHVFYALQNFHLLIKIGIASTAAGIILQIILVRHFAYEGLALASSLTLVIHSSLLVAALRGMLGGMDGKRICLSFLKVCAASILAVVICTLLAGILIEARPRPFHLLCLGTTGVGSFLIMALLLRVEELSSVLEVFRKSLFRE